MDAYFDCRYDMTIWWGDSGDTNRYGMRHKTYMGTLLDHSFNLQSPAPCCLTVKSATELTNQRKVLPIPPITDKQHDNWPITALESGHRSTLSVSVNCRLMKWRGQAHLCETTATLRDGKGIFGNEKICQNFTRLGDEHQWEPY